MSTPASCSCLICHPDPETRATPTIDTVSRHGWTVVWVAGNLDFAYTVGLYHTFGQPEQVMFGLEGESMQHWLNASVEVGRDKDWPATGEPFAGVLEGFQTQLRDVHPSWYRALFGPVLGFYRGIAVPVRQLVWPDRAGLWPWQDDATPSSRNRQAQAWLPVAEHPQGPWRLIGELEPDFPFPTGPDTWVLTTRGVLDGSRPVATVAFDQGAYDVLDERGYAAEDLCLGFLGNVVRRHPAVTSCADLGDGQVATAGESTVDESDARTVGGWTRGFVTPVDRRSSKRAWTLAEPA